MSNNHNFNHFTGKKKSCKSTKRKKHRKVQKEHKNKYDNLCKVPKKTTNSRSHLDIFSEEAKAHIAKELYPFTEELLIERLEAADANFDYDF